ncbi:MAG: NAD(P)H-dependent oxidoreductase subunit E [Actinomycetota bacterium]|nr:NAD(P)H-dependent oxidoreductase subunit E [Actinomycetota bacterium]
MADLHFTADRATAAEQAAIDSALLALGIDAATIVEDERVVRGGVGRRNERRHGLLPGLHALQRVSGWITPGGLNHLCAQLGVPPAEAYGVASFYDLFRTEDPGHTDSVHHVCIDVACQIAGAEERVAELEAAGHHVHRSPCLGQCERPVAVFVQGRGGEDVVPIDETEPTGSGSIPQRYDPTLVLLARVGRIDPTSLDSYVGAGGYKALAQAFTRGPAGVIDEIIASGLSGRGGAAFPTGVKLRAVAAEPGPRYVVANADESEPGTFKDRIVMENDPFAVVEALTIAGFAAGAAKGWIYIRGEYPLATRRLQAAVDAARVAGFLGERIARSSFSFDVEIRRGAGAYICGEETALFSSLEGFRGEPRQKPPFPTTHGLFGRPTAVNNPETLLNLLEIVSRGGGAYAAIGTEASRGRKLFCVSGDVGAPGLYEVPFGPTLREVLDLAGGVDGQLQAVLLGGAAGSFVRPDQLDVPLTFEGTREAGLSLGSGVVMAFNQAVDLAGVVIRIAEFFRDESCGQCVPCRVGAVRQHELLVRTGTRLTPPELVLLDDMDRAMKDASICGLGHTACTAVRSAFSLGLLESSANGGRK